MANEPQTTWLPAIGNGEYNNTGIETIADASGKTLADAASNLLVDSGVTFSQIPATVWTDSEGTE